jgi:hypothetical protein
MILGSAIGARNTDTLPLAMEIYLRGSENPQGYGTP